MLDRLEFTPENIEALYFLTARKESPNGGILRKYFEENRYLKSKFVDFGFDWEIHPAYRWALQPDTIEDIFRNLELSADE
ncbi:MAG: hypothetical protein KME57_12465 [Scytonema hyalinum WJT4-NPBG1]|jgi:hypothetical protein|nr:hypothetical protein [Scytonema hyalinum WJT4-NPBG1]